MAKGGDFIFVGSLLRLLSYSYILTTLSRKADPGKGSSLIHCKQYYFCTGFNHA